MRLNRQAVRDCLRQCDYESFKDLFIDELGWDNVGRIEIPVGTAEQPYMARAVVEKKGVTVYHCQAQNPAESGADIPDSGMRRKIDQKINSYTREHLIIYTDSAQREQLWQWVRREKGKPLAPREYRYQVGQDGEGLIQRLERLAIGLDDEEDLTTVDVKKRNKAAFDVDKVTKKFFDRFQKEHKRFLDFVLGITEKFDREWYASVMLNRLMFVYFLQKKRFLNDDTDYLQNRLKDCRQGHGDDEFYSFYRYFLLRLFHEGLGDSKRDNPELEQLIGKIPYLNGGLFDVHELEEQNPNIQIPDEAFEALFEFFDEYDWHLDDRPLRSGKEINPDVLGYIFEKYINQKQMGAYYTKEDITEYISKNTIVPFLFDAAKKKCAIAFDPDGPVWRLLKENPERYIYAAVKKGVIEEDSKTGTVEVVALPAEIEAGIEDVAQRGAWNRLADEAYALPTELWREHVARRLRCLEVREKMAQGEVHEINDLITYNLDIRQFAQDVIAQCEGPELLRAFYQAISRISVLDPTCGSGAFLFAALNILEPLYEACLQRMAGFVDDLDRLGEKARPEKFSDFRKVLEQVAKHPNREYFILKSIILENLYGVDIMKEAVEICKLRLFLKLVSQVDAKAEKPNYGLEPLPDIDFNIRAGNTLVGFATYDEVKKAVEGDGQQKLDLFSDMHMPRIAESAEIIDRAFQMFRLQQIDYDMDAAKFKDAKIEVRERLKGLNDELNCYLARQYGINLNDEAAFESWLSKYKPLHWFVEFYRIIESGGFDVVVGNPPYVENSKIKEYKLLNYATQKCGNIYASCVERSSTLLKSSGTYSMIVPLSGFSTGRMEAYQNRVRDRYNRLHISYYSGDANPSKLFDGVKYRLCIIIGQDGKYKETYTSQYLKWYANERGFLFPQKVNYEKVDFDSGFLRFSKIGTELASRILHKINNRDKTIDSYYSATKRASIDYHRSPVSWIRAMDFEPYFNSATRNRSVDHLKTLFFEEEEEARAVGAVLNSTLFYFWFSIQGNCRNIAGTDLDSFPIGELSSEVVERLNNSFLRLMENLKSNSRNRIYNYKHSGKVEYQEFYPNLSKPEIDEIDCALADHYGFSKEELDFIINYDIKYRMGMSSFENN